MKKKMGAPKKEIDQEVFEGLCGLQCTLKEVCEFFHVSKPTLERWCKETYGETFFTVFGKKRGQGIISLRRNMFKLSESSAAICIFMAKNWLGMKDNPVEGGSETPENTAKAMRNAAREMRKATHAAD